MRKNPWMAIALALLAGPAVAQRTVASHPAEAIREASLRRHIEVLASREFAGRGAGVGAEKTRAYLVDAFRRLGLQPAGERGYFQDIPATRPREGGGKGAADEIRGRNLLALLEGGDPDLRAEILVLSAHYDHLGRRGTVYYPGADDNASGVATLLEVARVLSAPGGRPRRSILFASFDLEERGLVGSRHYLAHPTRPLKRTIFCLNLDMLGRRMLGVLDGYLFFQGWECTPALKPLIRSACAGESLAPGLVATDLTGVRSDHGPFLWAKIPFLFLSSGEHPDYHRPSDAPDRIRYGLLLRRARVACRILKSLADQPAVPRFSAPVPDLDEARSVAGILAAIAPHADALGLGTVEKIGLGMMRSRLSRIVKQGVYRARDRADLKTVARRLMRAAR